MKNFIASAAIALSIVAAPSLAFAQQHHGSSHGQRHGIHKPTVKKPVVVQQNRWTRNRVLPPQYRRNVVTDYRRHNLRAPTRHQRWVKVDRQYLLINSLTGMVVALGAMH
jgi:Ni/Co efflux regulator RcnB